MAATANVQASPFEVRPGGEVNVDVKFNPDPPPAPPQAPNDMHLEYRELNSTGPWTPVSPTVGPDIPAGANPAVGFRVQFTAPNDVKVWDLRLRWTLNGDPIAERTAQFSVATPRRCSGTTTVRIKEIMSVGDDRNTAYEEMLKQIFETSYPANFCRGGDCPDGSACLPVAIFDEKQVNCAPYQTSNGKIRWRCTISGKVEFNCECLPND